MEKQIWKVETSHIVYHPPQYEVQDHFDLYRQLQVTADERKARVTTRPIGPLEFRAIEQHDEAVVIHAFFRGKDGKKLRFMRLRRIHASS